MWKTSDHLRSFAIPGPISLAASFIHPSLEPLLLPRHPDQRLLLPSLCGACLESPVVDHLGYQLQPVYLLERCEPPPFSQGNHKYLFLHKTELYCDVYYYWFLHILCCLRYSYSILHCAATSQPLWELPLGCLLLVTCLFTIVLALSIYLAFIINFKFHITICVIICLTLPSCLSIWSNHRTHCIHWENAKHSLNDTQAEWQTS